MINFQSKTTKQAVQQNAKQNTKQMEEETRKMETRLQELKLAMENERQQRTQSGNPGFWSRGQAGAMTNYKAVSAGSSKKPAPPASGSPSPLTQTVRKVKLIKDEPLDMPERPQASAAVPGTLAYLAKTTEAEAAQQRRVTAGGRVRGAGAAGGGGGSSGAPPRCGQCEDRPAAVLCPECAEEYCAKCFAAFHLKGALRKHRSLPLSAVTTPRQSLATSAAVPGATAQPSFSSNASGAAPVFEDASRQSRRNMVRQLLNTGAADTAGPGDSLLSGEVDERQNAAEFQRALAEWRSSGSTGTTAVSAAAAGTQPTPRLQQQQQQQQQHRKQQLPQQKQKTVSHGTGTDDGAGRRGTPGLDIKFTSSLSYAEQLLLQKHRRADVGQMPSYRGAVGGGSGVFEEIRSMQRQLSSMSTSRGDVDDQLDDQKFVTRTNRTQVDDLFPERQTPRTPGQSAAATESDEHLSGSNVDGESKRPPTSTGSRAAATGTPRGRQPPTGLEWQQQPGGSRTPRTPGRPNSAATSGGGRLTAAATSGALTNIAAISRRQAVDPTSTTTSTFFGTLAEHQLALGGSFLLMGVDRSAAVAPKAWSSGDSRPASAASSRPPSASGNNNRVSNRFYALSGARSWRPGAAIQPPAGMDPDQLRRTRAEVDRLATLAAAEDPRLRLEDVEVEAEARVLAAMPLSRPVSARAERQRARAVAVAAAGAINGGGIAVTSRPGTAEVAGKGRRSEEELDVTADYLMDDVEHLSRLAVELAESNVDADPDEEVTSFRAAGAQVPELVFRDLTQEDKEKQLQEWDDNDMERMDTERYNDREEVRQLH